MSSYRKDQYAIIGSLNVFLNFDSIFAELSRYSSMNLVKCQSRLTDTVLEIPFYPLSKYLFELMNYSGGSELKMEKIWLEMIEFGQ